MRRRFVGFEAGTKTLFRKGPRTQKALSIGDEIPSKGLIAIPFGKVALIGIMVFGKEDETAFPASIALTNNVLLNVGQFGRTTSRGGGFRVVTCLVVRMISIRVVFFIVFIFDTSFICYYVAELFVGDFTFSIAEFIDVKEISHRRGFMSFGFASCKTKFLINTSLDLIPKASVREVGNGSS